MFDKTIDCDALNSLCVLSTIGQGPFVERPKSMKWSDTEHSILASGLVYSMTAKKKVHVVVVLWS